MSHTQYLAEDRINRVDVSEETPLPTTGATQDIWAEGFSLSGASVLSAQFSAPVVGAGVTYNQTSGSLNVVSGTTVNSEFLARSQQTFSGAMRFRASAILSQRIANSNFAILLADIVGEGLAYNIVNSTTLDVTATEHGYTAQMVGQFILAGGFTGAAAVPGRYAIASLPNANTIRLTVSGFPASGTGTCTLFGRNYVRNLFTGTTATAVNFDAQRNGWATGDTAATINTTASPGTILVNDITGRDVFLLDTLRASTATPTFTARASRYENLPDQTATLYVFIWCFNGTVAPASTTTLTIGHLAVEPVRNDPLMIAGFRSQGAVNSLPVNLLGGTITTVTSVTTAGVPPVPATAFSLNSAATTNGSLIITGTSGLQAFYATNIGATAAFVKLYNKATAPTVGTDTPLMIIPVPAAVAGVPGVASPPIGYSGHRFPLGLGIAITGAVADNDTTAVAAGQVKVILSRTV
ncbi:hypothetical protein UFOVP679_48 [uncultured Caudovirales phage]|uniref:Uncharacterized protein n=1 Tax=uncultured Caudovirales phage TaxID=2100421 RepID=A0A6J5NK53_9CAUD|nr:hypothetical protein UFOVP679_48 [uncultured Caudovirales phage]